MTVAIITDGAVSLPGDCPEKVSITVVPLRVLTGAADGVGLAVTRAVTLAEILAAPPGQVRTSCPAPARYLAAIGQAADGDGALICTTAASLSGSYQAALQAARRATVPVRVVDTGTAAGGQGLIVRAAAEEAGAGAGLDAVTAAAERLRADVRLVGTLDNLDRLVASGRLSRLAGWTAAQLGVHPVFELHDGRIRELRPAHSPQAAEARIVGRLRARYRAGAALHVCALHVSAPQRAQRVLAAVAAWRAPDTAYISEFDVAMAVHTGPGVVGLAWALL
jgi:DegV family protein with EDD domain